MAEKQVLAYVGNTGYGWGLRTGVGLTERLMQLISEGITEADSITMGQVLADAKRTYLLENKRYDVFDEKVLQELTLFGIPNTHILNRVSKGGNTTDSETEKSSDMDENTLTVRKNLVSGDELKSLPPGLTELDLDFTFGAGTYTRINTDDGDYYTLNTLSSGEVGDCVQPHFVYDSYLSGTAPHGVLFTGGSYSTETPFNPVIAVPRSTNEDKGEGSLPMSSTFTPRVRISYGTTGGSAQKAVGQTGYTTMAVHTGYYDEPTSTQYLFSDMQFAIYYSNDADLTPPTITDPGGDGFHAVEGMSASFSVEALDASPVYRVIITYNDERDNNWKTFDLSFNSVSSLWEGTLTLKGDIVYFIQALDSAGNAGVLSASGPDLDGQSTPQPYGSTWEGPRIFSISLDDSDSDGLPDAFEDLYPCLNKNGSDNGNDPDYDYLSSEQEFLMDLNPCRGDSDSGGDNDGSEMSDSRDPFNKGDDLLITIAASRNGSDAELTWPDGVAENGSISGYYFVYGSDTLPFTGADLVTSPLPTGTDLYVASCPGNLCFYIVTNCAITDNPEVLFLNPDTGSIAGGTPVDMYGNKFQAGAEVLFAGLPADSTTVVTPNLITCSTPPHSPGAVTVIVRNPDGGEGLLVSGYTYQ